MKLVDAEPFIRDLTAKKSMYYAIARDGMIKALEDAPIIDAAEVLRSQWISVKDKLPGRYETVLIAISTVNGYGDPAKLVTIGGYDHSEKRWEQYTSTDRQLCRGETVTHWMPLPEPPGHRSGQDCYPNHTIEPAWKRQFMRTFLGGR
ncbi:MAG: DUF551 domain-containing protein [Clostridiaceae bacterium]|nr:DUF551 domain-containing protein [Clostridiaceae bacterium]